MDRTLRRELDAIARDRTSGAVELAKRAATAILQWLERQSTPSANDFIQASRIVIHCQPAMAPFARLANELLLVADRRDSAHVAQTEVHEMLSIWNKGQERISDSLERALERQKPPQIATFSYSSTVVGAIVHARRRVKEVWCSEGRPKLEGRRTARELGAAGIRCRFLTDAAMLDAAIAADILILGADAIMIKGFRNKVGSGALVGSFNGPVWVLADTTKFWPEHMSNSLLRERNGPAREVWLNAPKNVMPWNPSFGIVPYTGGNIAVLTERGWIEPAGIHRELKRIRISPQLKKLAD